MDTQDTGRRQTRTDNPLDTQDTIDKLSTLDTQDKLSTLDTQDTGRRPEQTIHLDKLSTLTQDEEKPEQTIHLDKLSTLDTQDTGRRQTRTDNPSR